MARGPLGMDEILESVGMVGRDHLDIRTVTLGINLRGCRTADEVVRRITDTAGDLIPITDTLASETGIPIVNRRIAVTPIAWVADRPDGELLLEPVVHLGLADLAQGVHGAASNTGVIVAERRGERRYCLGVGDAAEDQPGADRSYPAESISDNAFCIHYHVCLLPFRTGALLGSK